MPCHQVNLVSVVFQAKSIPHLEAALAALNWSYNLDMKMNVLYTRNMTIDLNAEEAQMASYQRQELNQLKVAYSTEVVKSEAASRRWVLKRRAAQKFEARRY